MRVIGLLGIGVLLVTGVAAVAQGPEPFQPVGTMREVMTSMTYPAANAILLVAYRGGPQNETEWQAVQRAAILLAESENVMMMRSRALDQGNWMKDARTLVDVGAGAYRAAREKNGNALVALSEPLNASCTTCHTQYRRNVHPRP